jgi:Rieske Fe-S protein
MLAAAALAACSGNGDQGAARAPAAPGQPPAGSASAGERLAATNDIPVGGGVVFTDKEIVVTQPTQGTFKAFSATCTHQGCTVSKVAGGTINCPCHGSKFAIADGSVVNGPATRSLEARQIAVSGGELLLES